tara:strand:- start:2291 stop:3598 length:1308 start_codon:yes stop_codon:yes gene_type:complete
MALDFLGKYSGDQKFLLRDFRNAARLTPGVNPPRQKFEGYVNFILNRELYSTLYGDQASNEFRTQISSLVRTADLPSVVFQTETKNAFNKKRIVNTGVTYNPVSMTVFDTVGNEWITTLMKYFSYHFMDPRNNQKSDDRDIAAGNIREGGVENTNSSYGPATGFDVGFNSNDAGYNLNASAQFFERIDYVLYHGNKGVQYSIINPMMSEFKPGSIDYSSSDVQEFSMTFDYERFTVYNKLNFDLAAEDVDRFEELGAITGDLFEGGDETKPLVLQEANERTLGYLGSEEERRARSSQPAYTKPAPPTPPAEGSNSETTDESGSGDETAQNNAPDNESPPGTYSNKIGEGILAGSSADSSLFGSDILGDIADSALSAVLRGQNVKDAVISTAVHNISTAIGSAIADNNATESSAVTDAIGDDNKIDPDAPNSGGDS